MHGVQAKAKAMPMSGAAQAAELATGRTSKRCSPVTREHDAERARARVGPHPLAAVR